MDILDLIKKQVEDQTKDALNVQLNSTNIKAIGAGGKSNNEFITQKQIVPQWIVGKYILQRDADDGEYTLTPQDFIETSSNVQWSNLDSTTMVERELPAYTNYMAGVQVWSNKTAVIKLGIYTLNGKLNVYTKLDGQESYTLKGETTGSTKSVQVTIPANTWVSLLFTFYGTTTSDIAFGANFNNINAWRHIRVSAPSVPTWVSANYEVIREATAVGRNTLKWNKDQSLHFSGNGVYRKATVDAGITTVAPPLSTLIRTTFGNTDITRWVTTPVNATINAGDQIAFSNGGDLHQVSRVVTTGPVFTNNPIFANGSGTLNWTIDSSFATITDKVAQIGERYMRLNGKFNTVSHSLVSATVNVTTSTFLASIRSSQNLLDTSPYNADGYKVNPSRWGSSGLATFASGTIGNISVLTVARGATFGSIHTRNYVETCYVSTSATYSFSCSASFIAGERLMFYVKKLDGTVVHTGTLHGDTNFTPFEHIFKPSASGSVYLSFTFPTRTAAAAFSTFQMGPMFLTQQYNSAASMLEYMKVSFYKSDNSACSTPWYKTPISDSSGVSLSSFEIFDKDPAGEDNYYRLPTDCAKIKLSYTASIDSSTDFYLDRRIYYMAIATHAKAPMFSAYATPYNLVRLNTNATTDSGTTLYLEQTEHLIDRPRQDTDGNVSTYHDHDIQDNTTYKYYLDAYDASALANRSALSTSISVTSGDTTVPKAPSGYTIIAVNGGIAHSWTNPTANDLKAIRGFTGNGTILWEMAASATGQAAAYNESHTTVEEVARKLRAVDASGNVSAYTSTATCTPKPEDNIPSFSVVITDGSGTKVNPKYNGMWYDQTVTASWVVTSSNVIASYLYRYKSVENGDVYTSWSSDADGVLALTDEVQGVYQFKVRDIYGNHSNTEEKLVYLDLTDPDIKSHEDVWGTSVSRVGLNELHWSMATVNDLDTSSFERSGLNETHITRAKIVSEINNYSFDLTNGSTLINWDVYKPATTSINISHNQSFLGGSSCRMMLATTNPGSSIVYHNKLVRVENGETITADIKSFPSLTTNASIFTQIAGTDYTTKAAVLRTVSNASYWQSAKTSWTNSGTATNVRIGFGIKKTVLAATMTDGAYFDDAQVYIDSPSFATIAVIPSLQVTYSDTDVEPWESYLYKLTFFDNVGRSSTCSVQIMMQPKPDERDEYLNMLDNSSFERTYTTGGGTLMPRNWERVAYTGNAFAKTRDLTKGELSVVAGDAYHGQHYINWRCSNGIAQWNGIAFNGITALPLDSGEERLYSARVYSRKAVTSGTVDAFSMYLISYNNNNEVLNSTNITLTGNDTWTANEATLRVTNPSLAHLGVMFVHVVGPGKGTLQIDAVQLQDTPYLSPYRDNKSVTADYIQGNLIRGHMIEAESILGDNIKADTVTTNELNLANANIYIKERDVLPIEVPSTGTFKHINFCLGSTGTLYPGYNSVMQNDGYICVGYCSNMFRQDTFVVSATHNKFINHRYGYPLISRSPDHGLMVLFDTSDLAYSSYSSLSVNQDLTDITKWTSPQSINAGAAPEDEWYNDQGCVRYDTTNDRFFFCGLGVSGTQMRLTKLTTTGTDLAQYNKIVGTLVGSLDLDISDSGTLAMCYSLGQSSTLHLVAYSTIGNVIVSTVQFSTYGGHDSTNTRERPYIDWSGVSYVGNDEYFLCYSLSRTNYVYYKVVKTDGTILVGDGRDLGLCNTQIAPGYLCGANQIRGRLMRTYSGDVLYYQPGVGEYNYGGRDGNSIGGKAIYFSKSSATINLQDLLNRIT